MTRPRLDRLHLLTSVFLLGLTSLTCLVFFADAARAAELRAVRLGEKNPGARVVLDLSEPTEVRFEGPPRPDYVLLRVDATLADPAPSLPGPVPGITGVVLAADGDQVLVQIELEGLLVDDSFALEAEGSQGPRWVLDLHPGEWMGEVPPDFVAGSRTDRLAHVDEQRGAESYTVVLDPGHGGRDQGTRGVGIALEKDVVLGISRSVAALLERVPGVQVVLTRGDDRFVPLPQRVDLARRSRGDVFVSIHANSAPTRRARGAEVYFLSLDGASDEAAKASEDRENAAWSLGVEGDTSTADDDLWSILVDLRETSTLQHSSRLAELVLDGLHRDGAVAERAVKQANFVVLRTLSMPAILVEAGFLSHREEARALASPEGQSRLGVALAAAIVDYLRQHGEKGDVPSFHRPRVHTVRGGDTLWTIAEAAGVDVDWIRDANALRGDRLRAGQTLLLP